MTNHHWQELCMTKQLLVQIICYLHCMFWMGGALLHKLPLPKTLNFSDVLQLYSSYIAKQYKVVTIVFYGDAISSRKDLEHQIRTKKSSVTVKFTESYPLLVGKGPFLSNNENSVL